MKLLIDKNIDPDAVFMFWMEIKKSEHITDFAPFGPMTTGQLRAKVTKMGERKKWLSAKVLDYSSE